MLGVALRQLLLNMNDVPLHGDCLPQFEPVAAVFADGLHRHAEVGAALSIWYGGTCVLDLWGGYVDRRRIAPWQGDTLACVFSISKALTATCLLQAADRGLLDLDAPVAVYWPEFAAYGKASITVAQLMSHQAGLPGLHDKAPSMLLYDWSAMCAALAAEKPWWPPGQAHGYHARTFGFLLGEVLRRVSGKLPGQWLATEMVEPKGLALHIGLNTLQQARCAEILPARLSPGEEKHWPKGVQAMLRDLRHPNTLTYASFQNPSLPPGYMNTQAFRAAHIPALNGHGTARDVARFFSEIPDLLSATTLRRATTSHSHGPDRVLRSVTHFGLGYMLFTQEAPIGWPGCFGHAGAGGSLAFCDPHKRLSFAFVMNQMQEGVVTGGSTANACVRALQSVL